MKEMWGFLKSIWKKFILNHFLTESSAIDKVHHDSLRLNENRHLNNKIPRSTCTFLQYAIHQSLRLHLHNPNGQK